METSLTEQNYLKALYNLSLREPETGEVNVKALADKLDLKMPTITHMLKKLGEKGYLLYEPYQAVRLTDTGKKEALQILRRHRLTELFLTEIMGLDWDQVHEIAEQIEHLNAPAFFNRMDVLLNYPRFDPHGDPIPDADGNLPERNTTLLSDRVEEIKQDSKASQSLAIVGVAGQDAEFLKAFTQAGLQIGSILSQPRVNVFDNSLQATLQPEGIPVFLSKDMCSQILVAG